MASGIPNPIGLQPQFEDLYQIFIKELQIVQAGVVTPADLILLETAVRHAQAHHLNRQIEAELLQAGSIPAALRAGQAAQAEARGIRSCLAAAKLCGIDRSIKSKREASVRIGSNPADNWTDLLPEVPN